LAGISRVARTTGAIVYAGWWWTVLVVAGVAGVAAILVLPRLAWRWAWLRTLAKLFLAAIAATPVVSAAGTIQRRRIVFMMNHTSYVDALVLAAVLPGEPAYLAKKEFADRFWTGLLLRRLGVLFVDRFDLAEGLSDISAAIDAAGGGRPLVVFPEGTFTRRAGLSGFYLGGFKIAAEAGLAVVPGVLRGTRAMLRSDQWLPRRIPISVEFGEPVLPAGSDFASIVRLRDQVRQFIAARCGEPDLNDLAKPALPPAR
jgi:1-acyl-sn-glycerol-3-phosphate acyltransferase